jgi:hypothetical protein
MGVPSEKCNNAAVRAEEDLKYVLEVLERCPIDIYQEGREGLVRCREHLDKIDAIIKKDREVNPGGSLDIYLH